jgi:hypothetical protein
VRATIFNMKKLSFLVLLILSITKVKAGWYECYNYKGFIDKYPVTLSIQINEGYYGDKKKDWNVLGVYKYDKQNTPIVLEGKFNRKTNIVALYEYENNSPSGEMEFNFSKKESLGTWKSIKTNKVLKLNLNFTSQLVDTLSKIVFNSVEILQTTSTVDKYFVGIYSKSKDDSRAKMISLKIIEKKTNKIFQLLDFSNSPAMGNIWTVIYGNVRLDENKGFYIWADIGRMGEELYFKYNKEKNIFEEK